MTQRTWLNNDMQNLIFGYDKWNDRKREREIERCMYIVDIYMLQYTKIKWTRNWSVHKQINTIYFALCYGKNRFHNANTTSPNGKKINLLLRCKKITQINV